VDAETFDAIFHLVAAAVGLDCEEGVSAYCREVCLRHGDDLRPCYPRDLCQAIRAIALYEDRKPVVTRAELDRAASGYFI
jgi:hypothetical protein